MLPIIAMLGAGCQWAFQLDPVAPPPDGAGPNCTLGPFSSPIELAYPPSGHDPYLAPSLLEVFYDRGTAGAYELYTATRPSLAVDFGGEQLIAEVDSSAEETDPSITADGLRLYFRSTRSGTPRTYEAIRPALDQKFKLVGIPVGLETVETDGLAVAVDGLAVFIDESGELNEYRRTSTTSPYLRTLASPLGMGVSFPTVSPDQLEVFYDGDNSALTRMTRADRDSPFTDPQVIDSVEYDPGLAADSRTMVVTVADRLSLRTRSCQ